MNDIAPVGDAIDKRLQEKTLIAMWYFLAFMLIFSFPYFLESFSFGLDGRTQKRTYWGGRDSSSFSEKTTQVFSDDMYDKFRYVISALTAKIKHGASLNPQELDQFRDCIDSIIEEAIRHHNLDSTEVNELYLTENDPFDSLRGFSNSWMLPEMENLNSEQYYHALNERNQKIQKIRKESGDLQPDEYQSFVRGLRAS